MAGHEFRTVIQHDQSGDLGDAAPGPTQRLSRQWLRADLKDDRDGFRRWLSDEDDQARVAIQRPLFVPVSGAPQDSNGLDSADPALADLRARRDTTKGRGIRIGIADTGIRSHKWLNGSFFALPIDWEPLDVDGDDLLDPQAGHGLFVAGLILQQAPGAYLHVARSLSPLGSGDTDEVMLDVLRLVNEDVHVLNLSLGTYADGDPHYETAWRKIIETALGLNPDLVIVCPAGNLEDNREVGSRFYPGAIDNDNVISVAALDKNRSTRVAEFSNVGDWVDFAAPGEDLLSTYLRWIPPVGGPAYHGYAYWSGTSFATAVVTGAIAACMSAGGTAKQAVEKLKKTDQQASGPYRLPIVGLDDWAIPRLPTPGPSPE